MTTGIYADLHSHSTISDGWTSPTDLVDLQAHHGLDLIALTDHDTFAAVDLARRRAVEHGLGFVVGVEITAAPPWRNNHILAHGVRPGEPALQEIIVVNRAIWRAGALAALYELRSAGLALPDAPEYEDQTVLVMPQSVARSAIRDGLARDQDVWAIIYKTLDTLSTVVDERMPGPGQIAEAIHAAGGLTVWAHPGQAMDRGMMGAAMEHFDAIEVFTPRHSPAEIVELLELCRDVGKPHTSGRDFHGHPAYERPALPLDQAYVDLLGDRVIWPSARRTA